MILGKKDKNKVDSLEITLTDALNQVKKAEESREHAKKRYLDLNKDYFDLLSKFNTLTDLDVLHAESGIPYARIAEILGISTSSVTKYRNNFKANKLSLEEKTEMLQRIIKGLLDKVR